MISFSEKLYFMTEDNVFDLSPTSHISLFLASLFPYPRSTNFKVL